MTRTRPSPGAAQLSELAAAAAALRSELGRLDARGGGEPSAASARVAALLRAQLAELEGELEAVDEREKRLARPPRGDDAKCADACEGDDGDCAAAACEGAAAFVEYDDERKAPQQLFACGFLPNCLTPDAYYTGAASSEAYI